MLPPLWGRTFNSTTVPNLQSLGRNDARKDVTREIRRSGLLTIPHLPPHPEPCLPYSRFWEAELSGLYHPGFPVDRLLVGVARWEAQAGDGKERSWRISSSLSPCISATVLVVAVSPHNQGSGGISPRLHLSEGFFQTSRSLCCLGLGKAMAFSGH